MSETKTVADLNPNSAPVKNMEMTVRRAMLIIGAFDALEKGEDWQDVPNVTWRKAFDRHYEALTELNQMWERYKDKTLHRQVLDLYDNLPPNIWKAKRGATPARKQELKGYRDGINRIRETFDTRRQRGRPHPNARGGR